MKKPVINIQIDTYKPGELKPGFDFKNEINKIVTVIAKEEKLTAKSFNFFLCDDAAIKVYNKKYLAHNFPTDILTFFYPDEVGKSGESDIIISLETVKVNSLRFKTVYDDEIRRVIIHGLLHLCGYGDKYRKEKTIMSGKENIYLKKLKLNAGKSN